jgi:hypothetical protein
MKVFFNGFWSGFDDEKNAVNHKFFINLMEQVYDTNIISTKNINEADILIENTQINNSYRKIKNWQNTFLFSGESYLHSDNGEYSCVLYGMRNHNNIVNVPLYIPYYVSSFDETYITENKIKKIDTVPNKDVIVIVSNPSGIIRNKFIDKLEKNFKVTFAGNYKNNTNTPLPYYYNSNEFQNTISGYKYILSMENSEKDTYITEKITHGLLSGSIPIYWGSKRVKDYFNPKRFLEVTDESSFDSIIELMKNMSDEEWLERVNSKPFTEFGSMYTTKEIAKHIKNLIFNKTFPNLTKLYFICNKYFEPVRYDRIISMCNFLNLKEYNYEFICPTFKHTISDQTMTEFVKTNRIFRLRNKPMKKSEISLYLNFISVWKHIISNYKNGIFLILESDTYLLPEIINFNNCLNKIKNKKWSAINISSDGGTIVSFNKMDSYVNNLEFRNHLSDTEKKILENNCIEDLSNQYDSDVRFIRKYYTRCTDSQLWSYEGCCQILNRIESNSNFDIPLDYYITETLESCLYIKYYWSNETYFDQASNRGFEPSTIQD